MFLCLDVCHLILGRNRFGFNAESICEKLKGYVRHIHLADAAGHDSEGLQFGAGERENVPLFKKAMKFDCMKVIEVWQGHLDHGRGFSHALTRLADLYA